MLIAEMTAVAGIVALAVSVIACRLIAARQYAHRYRTATPEEGK